MRRIHFACGVVIPVLVAGCTPTPQPTPIAPAPTIAAPTLQLMCTPEQGGAAVPCTQAEYDAMLERDKLYDEAKKVLHKYKTEYERVARGGGTASEELLALTAADFMQVTREEFSHGIRFEGGDYETVWVKRLVGESMAGSTVALELCSDSSSVTIMRGDETIGLGRTAEQRVYFAGPSGDLKIVAAQNRQVESC